MLEKMAFAQILIRPRAPSGKLEHFRDNSRPDDSLGHQFSGLLCVRVVRRVSKQIETGGCARNNVCRSNKADAVAGGLKVAIAVDPSGGVTIGKDEARRGGG